MIHIVALLLSFLMFVDPATQPTTALTADEQRSEEMNADGWQLFRSGQFEQSADKFQQAIDLNARNAESWNGLGWSHFNNGDVEKAVSDFNKCLELNPTHPAALNGIGQINFNAGKFDEAEKAWLKAAPTASGAWMGLAEMYLLQEKWGDAEKWAQKLVDSKEAWDPQMMKQLLDAAKNKKVDPALRSLISPQAASPSAKLINDAMKAWRSGHLDEAQKDFDEAMEKSPDDANVHNALGWFKLNGERNLAEAQEHFEKALQLSPGNIGAETGVATCLKMQGQVDAATEMFKKIVDQYPTAMNAAYSLAEIYNEKGEFTKALPILEGLAKQWPDNEAIKGALDKAKEGAKK